MDKKQQKNEAVPLARKQPLQVLTNEPITILDDSTKEVNHRNALRELRLAREVPASNMVAVVKTLYPGYDKTLQSKCERSHHYGVKLCDDAMEKLYQAYAPEKAKSKNPENRTNPHRLVCRVNTQDYNRIKTLMHQEGFSTIQDWLYSLIKKHLKEKEGLQNDI